MDYEEADLAAKRRFVDTQGKPSPEKRPRSRLQERMEQAMDEQHARRASADGSPESIPEAERELTIQHGQIDSVLRRATELAAKLKPVLSVNPMEIASAERPMGKGFDLTTDIGHMIRGNTTELGELEDFLTRLTDAVRL